MNYTMTSAVELAVLILCFMAIIKDGGQALGVLFQWASERSRRRPAVVRGVVRYCTKCGRRIGTCGCIKRTESRSADDPAFYGYYRLYVPPYFSSCGMGIEGCRCIKRGGV
jgi:hypothetical protein